MIRSALLFINIFLFLFLLIIMSTIVPLMPSLSNISLFWNSLFMTLSLFLRPHLKGHKFLFINFRYSACLTFVQCRWETYAFEGPLALLKKTELFQNDIILSSFDAAIHVLSVSAI